MNKKEGIKVTGATNSLTSGQQFIAKTQERQKKLFINL